MSYMCTSHRLKEGSAKLYDYQNILANRIDVKQSHWRPQYSSKHCIMELLWCIICHFHKKHASYKPHNVHPPNASTVNSKVKSGVYNGFCFISYIVPILLSFGECVKAFFLLICPRNNKITIHHMNFLPRHISELYDTDPFVNNTIKHYIEKSY